MVVHETKVRLAGHSLARKKEDLRSLREIDLCARLAHFFGASARLAAQGTAAIDLEVHGPIIRAEVKYLRPPAQSHDVVAQDWEWLLAATNAGREFSKRAFIVFMPSGAQDMHSFSSCVSLRRTRNGETQYAWSTIAPYRSFTRVGQTGGGRQRLVWRQTPPRLAVLHFHGGKRVRVDLVGKRTDPIWAALYTRTLPNATPEESNTDPLLILPDDVPVELDG